MTGLRREARQSSTPRAWKNFGHRSNPFDFTNPAPDVNMQQWVTQLLYSILIKSPLEVKLPVVVPHFTSTRSSPVPDVAFT